jgi:hypothetical protein
LAYRESFSVRTARWLRRLGWGLLALTLTAGAAAVGRLLYQFTYQSEFFRLDPLRVTIHGASEPLEAAARRDLGRYLVDVTDNLCRLDARRLAAMLADLPRAQSARVRKLYPNALSIQFDERRPLMVANLNEPFLIDEWGVLLDRVTGAQIARLGLPILTGVQGALFHPGDRIQDTRVGEVLAAARVIRDDDPALRGRLVEWNANGRGEVTAILAEGGQVLFGERPPLELLDKLSAALSARPDLGKATYIDLRMERQIVYKSP